MENVGGTTVAEPSRTIAPPEMAMTEPLPALHLLAKPTGAVCRLGVDYGSSVPTASMASSAASTSNA